MQTVILQHLRFNTKCDPLLQHSINFYVGQWLDNLKQTEEQLNAEADDEMTEAERECYGSDEDENDRLNKEKRIKARKLMDVFRERIRTNALSTKKNSKKKRQTSYIVVELSYDDAECVTKFLASKRHLAQSFNTYLTQILKILGVFVRFHGRHDKHVGAELRPWSH